MVPSWDSLSDSRVSFDEGLTGNSRTHSTALALTSRQGGANSAHGHGPGTELAPPYYKGVLIQRMDL
ncbi:hypothetical protein J6590_105418, partial [Homalodisca vitripennis]